MSKELHNLTSLYKDWFIDYASYVIRERAVPHINDGLKPVQRRILHSMWELEDGRYNKVANLVGNTMKYHPHGDASITDAMTQLGQKNYLIDMQGNWGSLVTGDSAAAARYIEARLSKLALDTSFNAKLTKWQDSYDGRNKEPISLPVKFPLLLAMGAEGIAVGLSCKILPHNFNELIDGAIDILHGKPVQLNPDFPTGGIVDVTDYQDGARGGKVKVRAKIEERGKYELVITEIPFGTTTKSLIESLVAAVSKEKLKIRNIEDNTAKFPEIILHLPQGADIKKTIEALFVFTDCEVSISPNTCVIKDGKPVFTTTTAVLENSVKQTKHIIQQELEIRIAELEEQWHFASLEKIFIEQKFYQLLDKQPTEEAVVHALTLAFKPFAKNFKRAIHKDDISKLVELRFKRLTKYDTEKAKLNIIALEQEIELATKKLKDLVGTVIAFFQQLKKTYGSDFPRRTQLSTFNAVAAATVAVANEKLYVDRAGGFVGTTLKDAELIGTCSSIDDIVVFFPDGSMKVTRIADKVFVGKSILYANVLKPGDKETVYNMIYQDGKERAYAKRFNVVGITRDKKYDLTQGTPDSLVKYFSVKPNAKVEMKLLPDQGARKTEVEFDFSSLAIKNRSSQGNVVTKYIIKSVKEV